MKTFPAMAFVGLVVVGCPSDANAEVKEVTVDFKLDKNSQCVSSEDAARKLSFKKKDVLVWTFVSKCKDPQKVIFCTKGINPLRNCTEDPESAKTGETFGTEAGTEDRPSYATVVCNINWNVLIPKDAGSVATGKKFCVRVVNGPVTSSEPKCPDSVREEDESCKGLRASELELDVQP